MMSSFAIRPRKVGKTDLDSSDMPSVRVNPLRLSLQRIFEKSKIKRAFSSTFDLSRESIDSEFDCMMTSQDTDSDHDADYDDVFEVEKPKLRRRHSFTTIQAMAQTLIEEVSQFTESDLPPSMFRIKTFYTS